MNQNCTFLTAFFAQMDFNSRMRIRFWLTLGLGLVFSNISLAQVAQFFEGHWSCEVVENHLKFQWEAHLVMDRQWLSGKTTKQGVVLSSDFWRVEKNGQPSARRVFLSDGSYVETWTAGWKKQKLKTVGKLLEKTNSTMVRETIKMKSEDSFESVSEKKFDDKWKVQSKEVCSRSAG